MDFNGFIKAFSDATQQEEGFITNKKDPSKNEEKLKNVAQTVLHPLENFIQSEPSGRKGKWTNKSVNVIVSGLKLIHEEIQAHHEAYEIPHQSLQKTLSKINDICTLLQSKIEDSPVSNALRNQISALSKNLNQTAKIESRRLIPQIEALLNKPLDNWDDLIKAADAAEKADSLLKKLSNDVPRKRELEDSIMETKRKLFSFAKSQSVYRSFDEGEMNPEEVQEKIPALIKNLNIDEIKSRDLSKLIGELLTTKVGGWGDLEGAVDDANVADSSTLKKFSECKELPDYIEKKRDLEASIQKRKKALFSGVINLFKFYNSKIKEATTLTSLKETASKLIKKLVLDEKLWTTPNPLLLAVKSGSPEMVKEVLEAIEEYPHLKEKAWEKPENGEPSLFEAFLGFEADLEIFEQLCLHALPEALLGTSESSTIELIIKSPPGASYFVKENASRALSALVSAAQRCSIDLLKPLSEDLGRLVHMQITLTDIPFNGSEELSETITNYMERFSFDALKSELKNRLTGSTYDYREKYMKTVLEQLVNRLKAESNPPGNRYYDFLRSIVDEHLLEETIRYEAFDSFEWLFDFVCKLDSISFRDHLLSGNKDLLRAAINNAPEDLGERVLDFYITNKPDSVNNGLLRAVINNAPKNLVERLLDFCITKKPDSVSGFDILSSAIKRKDPDIIEKLLSTENFWKDLPLDVILTKTESIPGSRRRFRDGTYVTYVTEDSYRKLSYSVEEIRKFIECIKSNPVWRERLNQKDSKGKTPLDKFCLIAHELSVDSFESSFQALTPLADFWPIENFWNMILDFDHEINDGDTKVMDAFRIIASDGSVTREMKQKLWESMPLRNTRHNHSWQPSTLRILEARDPIRITETITERFPKKST